MSENTNGLIPQYFPKGSSFELINDEHVHWVMDRLVTDQEKLLDLKLLMRYFYSLSLNRLHDFNCCTYYLNPGLP